MNGKLYIPASSWTTTGDNDIRIAITKVLLEIDYVNGETHELWEGTAERNSSSDIFAVSGGKFYGIEKIYPKKFRNSYADDDERMEFHNDTQNTLFFIDPDNNDTPMNIIHRGTEYEFNPHLRVDYSGENPHVYYHSCKDKTIYWLDLLTGESTKIVDNIPGTKQITGVFGGRVFMVDFLRDNEVGYRWVTNIDGFSYFDDASKMHEALFFVDIATGEIGESTIITKRTLFKERTKTESNLIEGGFSGNTDGYTDIIYEEDEYFYIEIERWEKEFDVWYDGRVIHIYLYRHLIGRIPTEDYWQGNSGAIEELGWIDWEEFLDLRGIN